MTRIIPFTPSAPGSTSALAASPGTTPATPDFASALLSAGNLAVMPLTKRPPLLGAWMKQGDLGYLFAPRGAGKSWMAMLIGNAVALGRALGEWTAGDAPRKVFYFDAEMNLADVQERANIIGIHSPDFHWLSNEWLFVTGGQSVNIADPAHQQGLSAMLPDGCFFIIDNLSTAQIGMSENDNDSFDAIRDWLLRLRHRTITVMIVHHAGRNGAMRGASRREDMSHWIISLKDATDGEQDGGKAFTTTFAKPSGKVRNCQEREAPPLRWSLKEEAGRLVLGCKIETGTDALLAHINEGVGSATELAELLGVQPGTVSKWARKLIDAGLITKDGRDYRAR